MKSLLRSTAGGIVVALALFAVLGAGAVGCGSGGSSDTEVDAAAAFVGTWDLYEGDAIQGSPTWYVHFAEDLTFYISDNADGSRVRVSGTYTVTDGALEGPFTNPGVGEGRVEATITDDVIALDFIEYWHTPNKVVSYVGELH